MMYDIEKYNNSQMMYYNSSKCWGDHEELNNSVCCASPINSNVVGAIQQQSDDVLQQ